jgi:hypothetical protein
MLLEHHGIDRPKSGWHFIRIASAIVVLTAAISAAWALGFPAVFPLASLDGTNGFRLDGVNSYDYSGWSVAGAGDVNGDGFADVIVGAFGADPYNKQSGSAYVVFGQASGFAATTSLSSLNAKHALRGFRLDGRGSLAFTGKSVAAAGDVNGDGFDDVIIGAPNANSGYVVFGKAKGFVATLDLSTLDGANGFRLAGGLNDGTGNSVAGAGDVNGDGFSDVIINGSDRAYVVFGKASGFPATVDLSGLRNPDGVRLKGTRGYGLSVAGAGDVNHDGFNDVIVGAPYAGPSGSSYVVFGKASFPRLFDVSTLDGANGFRLDGPLYENYTGGAVASAGDVNGDGFADVIVGEKPPSNKIRRGASFIVFGKASGFQAKIDLSTLDGTTGFRLNGGEWREGSGYSVAGAGDVTGDGLDDLLIGAPHAYYHSVPGSGSSYVFFGNVSGFAAVKKLSSLDGNDGFRLDGAAAYYQSGYSVAGAGDVNGDGFADIIIGAPWAAFASVDSGSAYVVFGHAPERFVPPTH